MSEDVVIESVVEEVPFVEVVPAESNTPFKSFLYRVFTPDGLNFIATVIAQSSTAAKDGLSKHYNDSKFTYVGMSTFILQVNG